MNKGISVVICCYNSAARLDTTIQYLSMQQPHSSIPWELIIVDNNSSDNTKEAAAAAIKRHGLNVQVTITDQPLKGLANARSKGIQTAAFEYILFCDDDNWLFPGYIERSYQILSNNENVAACGGKGIAVFQNDEIPKRWERHKRAFAVGAPSKKEGIIKGNFLFGAGLAFKRSVYNQLVNYGFEQKLSDRVGTKLSSGGDYELCVQLKLLGYDLYYDSSLQFYHYLPSVRLSDHYLVELSRAFGEAHSINVFYDYGLRKHSIPKSFFTVEVLRTFYKVVKGYFLFNNLDRKIETTYQNQKLQALLKNKNGIRELIENINAIKYKYQFQQEAATRKTILNPTIESTRN